MPAVFEPAPTCLAALVALPFLTAQDTNLHTLRLASRRPCCPSAPRGRVRMAARCRARPPTCVRLSASVIVLLALGPADTLTDKTVAAVATASPSGGPPEQPGDQRAAPQPARLPAPLPVPLRRGPPAVPHRRVGHTFARGGRDHRCGGHRRARRPRRLAGFTSRRYGTVVIYRRIGDARWWHLHRHGIRRHISSEADNPADGRPGCPRRP